MDRGRFDSLVDRVCRAAPYDAILAYRDLVRLEAPLVRERLPNAASLRKYDSYLRTYERPAPARHFTDHNYAQKLVPAVALVRSRHGAAVLDPACGNGFEAMLFALQGADVHASDFAAERQAIAEVRRQVYTELLSGAGLHLSVARASALTADGGPYDVVFVQEAISHIHPAEDFLVAARDRYLKPDGRLVVCDSNSWNPVTRLRISRHLWSERRTLRYFVTTIVDPLTGQPLILAEERLFSPVTMRRMMRRAGLVPEATWMSGFVPPFLVRRSADAAARRVDAIAKAVPVMSVFGGFYTITARAR